MRVVLYLWALPATAIGFLLMLFAVVSGAKLAVTQGVVEAVGGVFIRQLLAVLAGRAFAAITLGHVILATDAVALARCRAHEHVHVRQYECWGILFFPLYASFSLYELLRGRDPYWDNYFERQARARCATNDAEAS